MPEITSSQLTTSTSLTKPVDQSISLNDTGSIAVDDHVGNEPAPSPIIDKGVPTIRPVEGTISSAPTQTIAPTGAAPLIPTTDALPDDNDGLPDVTINQTVEAVPLPILPVEPPTLSGGGGGGGFGGGGVGGGEESGGAEPRKSWLPVILILTGIAVLLVKTKKKAA